MVTKHLIKGYFTLRAMGEAAFQGPAFCALIQQPFCRQTLQKGTRNN